MNNDVIDTIRLDITKSATNLCVYIRKADTRTLEMYLTNNGNVVDITKAIFAALYIEKEEDVLYQTITREGNKLRYTFHDKDVEMPGEMKCRVVISFKDDMQITSPQFTVIVEDIPAIPLGDSQSLADYNAITAALSRADKYASLTQENSDKAVNAVADAEVIFANIEQLLQSTETLVDILKGIESVTEDDIDAMWNGEYVPENEEEIADIEEVVE